ncbi:hypothetical protein EMIT0180MI3_340101 [Priestia megaterium]
MHMFHLLSKLNRNHTHKKALNIESFFMPLKRYVAATTAYQYIKRLNASAHFLKNTNNFKYAS